VYFWSLFRPASVPPPLVFALGVLADLLGQAPLGVSLLALLILHGLALRWRRFLARQSFLLVWLVFACLGCGAAALQYVLTAVLTFRLLPAGPAFFQAALSAGLYPLLAIPLARAHATLASPDSA
jgi:rod shape-determining protein MreD